ncbi:MAG: WD40 repeat domain-containing protein, partial [Bacteroidia bacterium]
GKLLMEIDSPIKGGINDSDATFSLDGKQVATTINNIIKIWDISSGKALLNYTLIHPLARKKIQFSPDGKILLAYSESMAIIPIWYFASKDTTHYNRIPTTSIQYDGGGVLTKAVFSSDSKNILTAREHEIDLWYVGLHKFLLEVAHLDINAKAKFQVMEKGIEIHITEANKVLLSFEDILKEMDKRHIDDLSLEEKAKYGIK